jgi:hypothetical protein
MWVVSVRWRGKGVWEQTEACHGIDLANELADEYREDRHAARVWWRVEGICSFAI